MTESIELSELLEIVNVEPCVSAMSLVTLLQINGQYPVPVNLAAQEQLLADISDQIVVDFQARNPQKRPLRESLLGISGNTLADFFLDNT